jgi:transcriptional regulator with XRE-family HTH domain
MTRAKPRNELAVHLKSLRQRIDPDVRTLGRHARVPARLGKRVTQEELAEVIGISREWYAILESGSPKARASTALVDRLADALMLTPEERAALFQLALPELARVQLRDDSTAVLGAFSRLNSLTKRLWAATSAQDVLTTASEQIAEWFDRPLLVSWTRRRDRGLWDDQAVDDERVRSNPSNVIRDMLNVLPTSAYDALDFYPRLANAGDVGTPDLYPPQLQRDIRTVYARHRVPGFAWVYARVRGRTGFVGGLYVAQKLGHSYSAADLAALGAFAELTSFALS